MEYKVNQDHIVQRPCGEKHFMRGGSVVEFIRKSHEFTHFIFRGTELKVLNNRFRLRYERVGD